ncbi:MAG: cysteine--tRNA ligase, partial [Bacilli bacterium]|nr:cysteine--tRNA ligase [Bacilli bacterium]
FLTVSLLEEKGYNPLVYRYFCLGSHYRKVLTFTYEALDQASQAYWKLKRRIQKLSRTPDLKEGKIDFYQDAFKEAISNDLNTSSMLTLVYDVLKDEELTDFTKLYLIEDFDKVLSLDLTVEDDGVTEDLESYILEKIEERNQAKKERDFEKADSIRDELLERGIRLIDGRDKTTYEII